MTYVRSDHGLPDGRMVRWYRPLEADRPTPPVRSDGPPVVVVAGDATLGDRIHGAVSQQGPTVVRLRDGDDDRDPMDLIGPVGDRTVWEAVWAFWPDALVVYGVDLRGVQTTAEGITHLLGLSELLAAWAPPPARGLVLVVLAPEPDDAGTTAHRIAPLLQDRWDEWQRDRPLGPSVRLTFGIGTAKRHGSEPILAAECVAAVLQWLGSSPRGPVLGHARWVGPSDSPPDRVLREVTTALWREPDTLEGFPR